MLGEMTRGSGRSIVCKGRALLSKNINRSIISTNSDRYNLSSSSRSLPFLPLSRCIHLGENPKNMSVGEAKRGSSSDPSILKTVLSYFPGLKKLKEPRGLKKGDTVDLSNLLFTKDRDYLIKCNSGQKVKLEQLEGKVVVIYFDSVYDMGKQWLKSLKRIYNDLQPSNNFEVIFVDTNDSDATEILDIPHQRDGEPFINEFPTMPWTAIPLSDIPSRKHLKQTFDIPKRVFVGTFLFVINSDGIISQWDDTVDIFEKYGVAGYPFTDARIDKLKFEDDEAVKKPSLNALLASSERNYLISNKGEKVSIHTLEDKVVALFFYTECELHRDFSAKLKVAYEELRVRNKDFEVVLIYLYDSYDSYLTYRFTSEETFSNTFKTMPWLALPFGDKNYYKLKRLFFVPWQYDKLDYGLIVIGPRMEFIQPFGLSILEEFKTPAYPFSCERVAKLVTEEAKKLELKMLWDPNSVFGGQHGSQVQLGEFVGKNVIILYDGYGINGIRTFNAGEIIQKLKERYELMGTNDEFEVIHITWEEPSSSVYGTELPWVQLVRDYRDEANFFGLRGTYTRVPSLLAFDRDGKIVRKTMFPTFDETKFPFFSGGMEEEALYQLIEVFDWDWLQEFYQETIYSSKKICDMGKLVE